MAKYYSRLGSSWPARASRNLVSFSEPACRFYFNFIFVSDELPICWNISFISVVQGLCESTRKAHCVKNRSTLYLIVRWELKSVAHFVYGNGYFSSTKKRVPLPRFTVVNERALYATQCRKWLFRFTNGDCNQEYGICFLILRSESIMAGLKNEVQFFLLNFKTT